MVSGALLAAYSFRLGANRSTKVTSMLGLTTSPIARVYISSLALFALPSGRLGSPRSSCAIGENTTSRGALLPLYFCAMVWATNSDSFFLNASNPSLPAYDSL